MGQSASVQHDLTAAVGLPTLGQAPQDPSESVDIFHSALERFGYVLERADLIARWEAAMPEFTCLDESTQRFRVCLTSDGRIRPVSDESSGVFEALFQRRLKTCLLPVLMSSVLLQKDSGAVGTEVRGSGEFTGADKVCAVIKEFMETSCLGGAHFFRKWWGQEPSAVGSGRLRDLFPIPPLLEWPMLIGSLAIRKETCLDMSNMCIGALNFLNTGMKASIGPIVMRRLDRILLGKIASTDECEAQALPSYDSIRSEAVDLPQMAATCDPCKLIHEELATAVQDPTKIFPAGASPMPVESVKANQRDEYVRVVVRELNCGKLRLTSKAHGLGGVFGVAKANGRQRKIWNGSVLSGLAAEPPKPYRLASPSSFLDVEIQPGERIYFSKRDASTFFDSLRVPEQLRTWFGQPPVTVEELLDAGLSFEHILDYKDGEDSLARRNRPLPTSYDEVCFVATDDTILMHKTLGQGSHTLSKLDKAFDERGIIRNTSKDVTLQESVTALGCDLSNDPAIAEPSLDKILRTVARTLDVLHRGEASPRALHSLLGVWEWFSLLQRTFFSIFDDVYSFVRRVPEHSVEQLPDNVMNELLVTLLLAPLLAVSLDREPLQMLVATDAAPEYGFGMSTCSCDAKTAMEVCRLAERRGDYVRLAPARGDPTEVARLGSPHRLPQTQLDFKTVMSAKAKWTAHSGVLEAHAHLLALRSTPGAGTSSSSTALPDRPTVSEVRSAGHQLLDLKVPGTNLEEQLVLLGGGKKLLLRAFSEDTPAAEPIVRRCSSTAEVLEHVLGVLQTGAESVNLVLGYEMLQLKFDKMDVVNEAEHRKKLWIITHYSWGPVRYYRLWPAPDPLQSQLDSMVGSKRAKQVQESILRQLRRGNALPEEVERFIESTGGEGSDKGFVDGKSDKLLRMLAKQATSRGFWAQETNEKFEPLDGNFPREGPKGRKYPPLPPRGAIIDKVDRTIQGLAERLGVLAGDVRNWQLLVDWEPLYIKTMKESLHEAQRLRMMCGDETGHVRMALKTVEVMEKMTLQERLASTKLSNTEWYAVARTPVMANKQIADDMFETFQQGAMARDRFEKSLEDHCKRVIGMVEGTLLPMAEHNKDLERQVMCLRQKADYLRYMFFWVPPARLHGDEIEQTYRRAAELAHRLHPRHVIGTSVFVNLAAFCAECCREPKQAAAVCRAGLAWGNRPSDRFMTPGETFGWTLLEKNLEALESQLVVLSVAFDADSFAKHKEALGSEWDEAEEELQEERGGTLAASESPEVKYVSAERLARDQCLTDWSQYKLLAAAFASNAAGLCVDRRLEEDGPSAPSSKPQPGPSLQMRASQAFAKVAARTGLGGLSSEQRQDCKVVQRWLSTMPLHQDIVDEDHDDDHAPPFPWQQVRWVETVEVEEERGTSIFPGMAGGTRRFLVACVVRLTRRTLEGAGDARRSRARSRSRSDSLEQESEPPGTMTSCDRWFSGRTNGQTQKIESTDLLAELGAVLTDDGVVRRPLRLETDRLSPGDVLQMRGPLDGTGPRKGVQQLRQRMLQASPDSPVELQFLRALKVDHASVVETAQYIDLHSNFIGWRDSTRNLKKSPECPSLMDMVEEIRETRAKEKGSEPLKPRRIPGFSARRNPVLAMNRGCKIKVGLLQLIRVGCVCWSYWRLRRGETAVNADSLKGARLVALEACLPAPAEEAWCVQQTPAQDQVVELPDETAESRKLRQQCEDALRSVTEVRQELAAAGARETRLREALRCRSASLLRLASHLTKANHHGDDIKPPVPCGEAWCKVLDAEVQTVQTLQDADLSQGQAEPSASPAAQLKELAKSRMYKGI
eukprot:s430_g12.t1